MKSLNVNRKTKLLIETILEYPSNLKMGKSFLNETQKALNRKEKTGKYGYITIQNLP